MVQGKRAIGESVNVWTPSARVTTGEPAARRTDCRQGDNENVDLSDRISRDATLSRGENCRQGDYDTVGCDPFDDGQAGARTLP